jgi:hypothetical protein
MAEYLVLIHGDEATWNSWTPEQLAANDAAHRRFNEVAGKAVLGGRALEHTKLTKSIRPDHAGGFVVTDGPYTETKEVIGGYYLLEAPDLDEAVRLAKLIPEASAPTSGVEVRPIMVFG